MNTSRTTALLCAVALAQAAHGSPLGEPRWGETIDRLVADSNGQLSAIPDWQRGPDGLFGLKLGIISQTADGKPVALFFSPMSARLGAMVVSLPDASRCKDWLAEVRLSLGPPAGQKIGRNAADVKWNRGSTEIVMSLKSAGKDELTACSLTLRPNRGV